LKPLKGGVVEKQEQKPPSEEPKAEQKIEAKKAPAAKEKPRPKPKPPGPPRRPLPFFTFLGLRAHLDQAYKGFRSTGKTVSLSTTQRSRCRKGIWYRLYAGTLRPRRPAEKSRRRKVLREAEVKETPFANPHWSLHIQGQTGRQDPILERAGLLSLRHQKRPMESSVFWLALFTMRESEKATRRAQIQRH